MVLFLLFILIGFLFGAFNFFFLLLILLFVVFTLPSEVLVGFCCFLSMPFLPFNVLFEFLIRDFLFFGAFNNFFLMLT